MASTRRSARASATFLGVLLSLGLVIALPGRAAAVPSEPERPGQAPLLSATPTRTPTPINVGNFVWDDLDADGVQDAGEPGLAGVTVQIWNSAKTLLIDSAVTNASGIYTLQTPGPGDYRVRVVLPALGDLFSPLDAASATDQTDSDLNPSGTNFGFTDIYDFASNLISITTLDAGLVNAPTATPSLTPSRTPTPSQTMNPLVLDQRVFLPIVDR